MTTNQGPLRFDSVDIALEPLLTRAPVTAMVGETIRQVVERMAQARVGSVVVVDPDYRPLGIFTQSDVLRRVMVPRYPEDAPIEEVMSIELATLTAQASFYDAMLLMATRGVRHLIVVETDGRTRAVISERDLFAVQRVGLRSIRKLMDTATDIDMLAKVAADVRLLTLGMLDHGVGPERLTQFISGLNDHLAGRIIELNLVGHDLYGLDWAWMALGSEGREEQTFSTDQDNGIIFACPDFADREELKLRFLAFARGVNEDLARCGFPLCKGNIMASNPEWCLTQEEWRERFADWIDAPDPDGLLNATIFFDFRLLYGKAALTKALRKWLLDRVAQAPLFLRFMVDNALRAEPPLGVIRDFVFDNAPGFAHTIDLKAFGTRLFVDAARILALANHIPESGTVARLRAAAAMGKMGGEAVDAMIDGFFFLQQLRLRHQAAGPAPGAENRVDPDALNPLDRQVLKAALQQARRLQARLKIDYRL